MITKEENILFCAEKLFAEKAFEGTSTREISKEANVNISMISFGRKSYCGTTARQIIPKIREQRNYRKKRQVESQSSDFKYRIAAS